MAWASNAGFTIWANAFVASGGIANANQYLPGAVPTDLAKRTRFLNYHRDITVSHGVNGVGTPKHQVKWNFSYTLPVGRGQRLLNKTNKVVDGVVGGWQLSALGYLVSSLG